MDYEHWRERVVGRTDITSRLTHLTRVTSERTALQNLIKILEDKTIIGSTTSTGFIVGNNPATCFQEVPILSLAENIRYEESIREKNGGRVRYEPYGIRINKQHAYEKGARPVIYGDTKEWKSKLDESDWYRIVNHNLMDTNNIIDWTHEREWRIKGNHTFDYKDIEIIVGSVEDYRQLVKYLVYELPYVLTSINGIICLDTVLK